MGEKLINLLLETEVLKKWWFKWSIIIGFVIYMVIFIILIIGVLFDNYFIDYEKIEQISSMLFGFGIVVFVGAFLIFINGLGYEKNKNIEDNGNSIIKKLKKDKKLIIIDSIDKLILFGMNDFFQYKTKEEIIKIGSILLNENNLFTNIKAKKIDGTYFSNLGGQGVTYISKLRFVDEIDKDLKNKKKNYGIKSELPGVYKLSNNESIRGYDIGPLIEKDREGKYSLTDTGSQVLQDFREI